MLVIRDISLSFGERIIFDAVNLTIRPGEKIGITGRNGSGKSTLFKLINGDFSPDTGTIEYPSKTSIGMLSQHIDLPDDTSALEECRLAFTTIVELEKKLDNVKKGLDQTEDHDRIKALTTDLNDALELYNHHGGYTYQAEIERVLTGLGFSKEMIVKPIAHLSGGWKMRIQLAKLLLQSPDYLLLDEPTNHLDIESILWLEQYLRQSACTVLLISHDQALLNAVTNATVEVDRGQLKYYAAAYAKAMELKQQNAEVELAAFKNQQREIAHKERLINKFRAKASKASFARALQKELDRMEKIEPDTFEHADIHLRFLPAKRPGRVIAAFEGVAKSYGKNTVIRDLSLKIEREDRLALIGQNGQGKTTLAKLLVRDEQPTAGLVREGLNIELAYYPQNAPDMLDGDRTVLETLERDAPEERRTQLRSILAAFLFRGEEVDKKVKVLSGGERARLAIAKMLLEPANVIVMDEPTHHLDMATKEILKNALSKFEGCLIVVSHDREFLTGLTSKILEFRDGRINQILGDISEYLRQRDIEDIRMIGKRSDQDCIQEKPQISQKAEYARRKELQRKIQYAERDIDKIEARIAAIQKEVLDPAFYAKPDFKETLKELEAQKNALKQKMEKWEKYQTEFELIAGETL